MRIGILGSGNIGGTAARLLSQAGHEVALSHAGPKESLEDKVAELGPRARAATVDEAADLGEVVLLAIRGGAGSTCRRSGCAGGSSSMR